MSMENKLTMENNIDFFLKEIQAMEPEKKEVIFHRILGVFEMEWEAECSKARRKELEKDIISDLEQTDKEDLLGEDPQALIENQQFLYDVAENYLSLDSGQEYWDNLHYSILEELGFRKNRIKRRRDARKIQYTEVEINGFTAYLTNLRIKEDSLPKGIYAYELRYGSNGLKEPVQASHSVLVNYFGTVLTHEPLSLNEDGFLEIDPKTDWKYLGTGAHKFEEIIENEMGGTNG